MLKICGYLFQGYKTYFHDSQDKDEIVQSLESHGISKRGLPRRIDGSGSYEGFSDWLIERARMDQERQPEKSFPATQTAPGVAAASLTLTLDNAPAVTFRRGGVSSVIDTEGDDSKPRSI
jgi:hypothetical protein